MFLGAAGTSPHAPERQRYWAERVERKGIFALINTGLLPRYADFTPAFKEILPLPVARKSTKRTAREESPVKPGRHPGSAVGRATYSARNKGLAHSKTPFSSLEALDPSAETAEASVASSAPRALLHISNGHVVENQPLMHFLSSTPLHAAGNAVTWIQFLERIALEYAIDLIILDTLAFSELCCPFVPHQVYGQLRIADIRPAIANWKHMHAVMHLPGRRYIGVDGYYAAILKVQATWRMYSQRKEYLEMCVSKTAARVILAFRRKCLTRARFYDAVKNALTAHVLAVTTMRAQLISNWSKTYTGSSVHVILHVPSASFSERIRFMMRDVRHYHEHSAGRLSSALVEKSRVIYVSPYPKGADGMLEQALRYVGRSTRAPRAGSRTVVIYPECVPQIPKRAPLSLGLYVSTASINKIRATIMQLGPNSLVTLVPYIIDAYDVRVASMCGVAHLALPLDQQTFYSTRPGFFDLMHRVENREQLVEEGDEEEDENGGNNGGSADESATAIDGPLGRRFRGSWSGSRPHLVDLTEEAAVWTRLAEFLLAHPRVRTWMFKIRDEAGRRGVALFHRRRLTFSVAKFSVAEIAEKIRAIPEAFTFMTPRYVKSALGHHLALYTLPLEVPKVSAAQSAAQRRNSIRTDGESDDSAGIGGSDHQSSAFGAREQSPMVGHVSSGGGGGLLHVPKPSRLVKRKGDGDGLQASREIFNSTSMLIPNLPATIDPRDLPVPAYPTVPAFISSFCKTGGTVEAMADGTSDSRVFVGCHLELHPTGETLVMETWETIPLHDFDHFLMVMPARQVPPDVIVGQAIKVAGAALEKGMVGHICIEFVAYLDNPIIDLHCIEILPYWSPTAGLAGFARVVMDARYDYPRMSAASGIRLHRQPAPPFTGMGVVGPGEYVTDMSHLRPSNLRMAGQAKWLDLPKLSVEANKIIAAQKWDTGEQVRCAVIMTGLIHPAVTPLSANTLNATLRACEMEMDDTMRRGVLVIDNPHKSILAINLSVTECIQSLKETALLLATRMQGIHITESTCNLVPVLTKLGKLQTRYEEIEAPVTPNLAALKDSISTCARKRPTVAESVTDEGLSTMLAQVAPWIQLRAYDAIFPPVPVKSDTDAKEEKPTAKAAEMYAAALFAQEVYRLERRTNEFADLAAKMLLFNTTADTEIQTATTKAKDRKHERRRDIKRSLRADRENALRLVAGGAGNADGKGTDDDDDREEELDGLLHPNDSDSDSDADSNESNSNSEDGTGSDAKDKELMKNLEAAVKLRPASGGATGGRPGSAGAGGAGAVGSMAALGGEHNSGTSTPVPGAPSKLTADNPVLKVFRGMYRKVHGH